MPKTVNGLEIVVMQGFERVLHAVGLAVRPTRLESLRDAGILRHAAGVHAYGAWTAPQVRSMFDTLDRFGIEQLHLTAREFTPAAQQALWQSDPRCDDRLHWYAESMSADAIDTLCRTWGADRVTVYESNPQPAIIAAGAERWILHLPAAVRNELQAGVVDIESIGRISPQLYKWSQFHNVRQAHPDLRAGAALYCVGVNSQAEYDAVLAMFPGAGYAMHYVRPTAEQHYSWLWLTKALGGRHAWLYVSPASPAELSVVGQQDAVLSIALDRWSRNEWTTPAHQQQIVPFDTTAFSVEVRQARDAARSLVDDLRERNGQLANDVGEKAERITELTKVVATIADERNAAIAALQQLEQETTRIRDDLVAASKGDLDRDGDVDLADAAILLRHYSGPR